MNPPPLPVPPIIRDQDAEHLRLLSIFHYVNGALDLAMLGILSFQYVFMRSMFTHTMRSPEAKAPPPEFVMDFFLGFIVLFGLFYLVSVVLNVMVGFFLEKRRHRIFSMVVAGLNCLQVPIGTALGIFTIIVLNRDSVRAKFAGAEQAPASA